MLITTGGDMWQVLGNSVIYLLIGAGIRCFMMRSASIQNFIYLAELALHIDAALDYDDFAYGRKTAIEDGLEFRNVSFSYGKEKSAGQCVFQSEQRRNCCLGRASAEKPPWHVWQPVSMMSMKAKF